jgi:hypothetical protein
MAHPAFACAARIALKNVAAPDEQFRKRIPIANEAFLWRIAVTA